MQGSGQGFFRFPIGKSPVISRGCPAGPPAKCGELATPFGNCVT